MDGSTPEKLTGACKKRFATAVKNRVGEKCSAPAGKFHPVVDPAKCEAKDCCVQVCPYDVFAIERIDPATYKTLPFVSKVKVWAHGMKTALTPNADACQACGLCVSICPEKAITLVAADAV